MRKSSLSVVIVRGKQGENLSIKTTEVEKERCRKRAKKDEAE